MLTLADDITSILLRRKYNRAEPEFRPGLTERIERYVSKNVPIRLVGFWGTGPKSLPNWADKCSCDFLSEINKKVEMSYAPGIEFTFIFATMHGLHNGYGKDTIASYTREMEAVFLVHGFKFVYLDTLWEKYGLSFDLIDAELSRKPSGWWQHIDNASEIEENASKRNIRLPAQAAAQKYYIMRDFEKGMLEKEFDGYIFHAFSDPRLTNVLPLLPTLFFYSRPGWSDTPWFVTEEKTETRYTY